MKISGVFVTRLIILGLIVPVVLSTIVYQGFSTNYTGGVFSKQGFEGQYERGIYKYRVLGKSLLLETYDLIRNNRLPTIAPASLYLLDQSGDPQFYSAYFYLNTLFLCLTCVTLFAVLGGHQNTDFLRVDLPLLLLTCLMTITQYVIVPYDTVSYFWLSVAALLILHNPQTRGRMLTLCVVVVLATLTRETAALIAALYFALNYRTILTRPAALKPNQTQWGLLAIVLCFVGTYAGLRFMFGYDQALFQDFRPLDNLDVFSALSVLFLASLFLLVAITRPVTPEIRVLCVATLPYVGAMFLVSHLWEIRLWTPIVLLLIILKIRAAPSPGVVRADHRASIRSGED